MKSSQTVALVVVLIAIALIVVAKTLKTGREQVAADAVAVALLPDPQAPEDQAPKLPALLELGSVGCKACKQMEPIIAALTEELSGKVDVTFTDVVKHPEVAKQYDITTIPTQVFLDAEGKELFRHIGVFEKEEILAKLKELGMLKE